MFTNIWPTHIFFRGGSVKFENLIIDHNAFSMEHQFQAENELFFTRRRTTSFSDVIYNLKSILFLQFCCKMIAENKSDVFTEIDDVEHRLIQGQTTVINN